MAKTRGQKVIEREKARAEKERKKQIEKANRMLIPVQKPTQISMNLMSFDPIGTFRFADGRWVKCYQVTGTCKEIEEGFVDVIEKLHSEIRITKKLAHEVKETYLTLTLQGEIYDEVRTKFIEDEATLKGHLNLVPCNVDEMMKLISEGTCDFSYASMVRGKKNWKTETFPEITESSSAFKTKGLYGEACFIMQFPNTITLEVLSKLKELGCDISLSLDLKGIDSMGRIDYNRALEQKYSRRLDETIAEEYINLSIQLMFLCDSNDAREIIEKTIFALLANEGFVVGSSIGAQKLATESMLSYGLMPRKYMRNVAKKTVSNILGKEELWQ